MNEIKAILIEGTSKTPQIDFNNLTGELILSGKSIPENAAKVYDPLLLWINDYIKEPRQTTNFRLDLEYFNSASSLWLAKIIKVLSKIDKDSAVVFIHIYFDIEDFESMDTEDLRDLMGSLVGNIGESNVSIGIKTYGVDDKGEIIKESHIMI